MRKVMTVRRRWYLFLVIAAAWMGSAHIASWDAGLPIFLGGVVLLVVLGWTTRCRRCGTSPFHRRVRFLGYDWSLNWFWIPWLCRVCGFDFSKPHDLTARDWSPTTAAQGGDWPAGKIAIFLGMCSLGSGFGALLGWLGEGGRLTVTAAALSLVWATAAGIVYLAHRRRGHAAPGLKQS